MTRPRAQTIPYPWPTDLPARYDLVWGTILARSTYGHTVAEMLEALAGLGVGVEVYRKPVVPSAPEGIWFTRAIVRWAKPGKSSDSPDSYELYVDLTDPIGQQASPEVATLIEDLAICGALDRLVSDYDRGAF